MTNKPTLALIASYNDDSCGIASLARLLNKVLSVHFTVKVFSLDSKLMKNHNLDNEAEDYINNIAKEIQNFDYVNIHQELGLYGTTVQACKRRIINLCNASKNLIHTLHAIQINDGSDFAEAYNDIMVVLQSRSNPYCVLTYNKTHLHQLNNVFKITNAVDYPPALVTKEEKDRIFSINKNDWKKKMGFNENDVLIGTFGNWVESKNRLWILKALEHLPENYKLLFFGGAHPLAMQHFEININTKLVIDFIEERLQKNPNSNLINRIRCFGVIDNDSFFNEATAMVDFCVAPYYENGQSTSGTTSIALELGSKLITTYTKMFLEHRHYWPDCFEMFDIGNWIELRDKILYFSKQKAENVKLRINDYTPEKFALFYTQICDKMQNGFYNGVAPQNNFTLENAVEDKTNNDKILELQTSTVEVKITDQIQAGQSKRSKFLTKMKASIKKRYYFVKNLV